MIHFAKMRFAGIGKNSVFLAHFVLLKWAPSSVEVSSVQRGMLVGWQCSEKFSKGSFVLAPNIAMFCGIKTSLTGVLWS